MTLRWVALACLVAACHGSTSNREVPHGGHRDVAALERLALHPQSCGEDDDCPTGSHCAGETCAWACLADSECGAGRHCDLHGACVAGAPPPPPAADDSAACQAVPASERRDALLQLFSDAQNGSYIMCFDDDTCPCGSHCSVDAVCQVDCLASAPPPALTCGTGLACTPLGRCATAPTTPPPPLVLTIAFSELTTTANTATAAVVKPLTVTVAATSLDVLSSTTPAVVKLSIAEVRTFQQGQAATGPDVAPRVRCASGDAFADSCEIAGGWTFDVASGQLRSAPKTIWVEVPQTTTAEDWTLEARSDWAADPARDVIRAAPVIAPATDPGNYHGTIQFTNDGAIAPADVLSLPIDAIVTPTNIVVLEPSRVLFPDGHVVLSRDGTKSTLLGWLAADTARYDIAINLVDVEYDSSNGHLNFGLEVTTGTGKPTAYWPVSVDRTGDVDAPACPCAAGSYCNATLARCLPGSGPPAGGGIVPQASAIPTSTLASSQLSTWLPPLQAALAASSGLLGGSGAPGIVNAYCFQSSGTAPPQLGTTQQGTSGDLSCVQTAPSTVEYAQPAFAYENTSREFDHATLYDLFESCLTDLGAQPTGAPTVANLLPARPCASLGRIFLALAANQGQTLPDTTQRLVDQVLRQWLGVHAYVATSAIQDRAYDDALAQSSTPANERLGSILDTVDAGLRLVLDPRVRPQYATGDGVATAMAAPDYRQVYRPVVRWTFNELLRNAPDAEGTNTMNTSGVDVSNGDVYAQSPPGTGSCVSSQPVALDDRRFTIMAQMRYVPQPNTVTVLVDKVAPNGDRLWVEATSVDATGRLTLTLRDSFGATATFPPIWGGQLAIVADSGTYRLYTSSDPNGSNAYPATSVTNGGPRWGAAGPVRLACGLPLTPTQCTSWDRNTIGDGLDVTYRAPFVETGTTTRYTCSTQNVEPYVEYCDGYPSQPACDSAAANRRNQIMASLLPNPPWIATILFSASGTLTKVGHGMRNTPKFSIAWEDWRCDYTLTNYPDPITAVKPVCGALPQGIRWDEVSLWTRPIQLDEFKAMVASYGGLKTNTSLPPRGAPPVGKEQEAALPVHLVEAASADLDLLGSYIEAERAVMYDECYFGGPSPARDRAAARAGKNLRLVMLLEGEAEHLAGLPGAATAAWYPRYVASHRELAGRRTKVLREIELAAACKNPLGITEQDLPLYIGEEVGATAKFFASSRFLTGKAKEEIALAQGKLSAAQSAYVSARESAYQLDVTRETKTQRVAKLRSDIESSLLKYCGKPVGSEKLLDGFINGTMNPFTCFVAPACLIPGTALGDLPPACLRGEIGSRVLALQAAKLDMSNATNTLSRTIDQYDGDMTYCARRQEELHTDEQILAKHDAHMQKLRDEAREDSMLFGFVSAAVHLVAQDYLGYVSGVLGLAEQAFQGDITAQEEREDASYQEVKLARSNALDIADCYHKVDNEKFSIDAAHDTIKRANQEVVSASFEITNDINQLQGILDEGLGQLAVEDGIDATPPHLHYWLGDDITEYQRHLAYARRLTYLALRAFEYESQQSLGQRGPILNARRPDELLTVVTNIEARNAPMQGELGLVVGSRPIVLSLRDEILHIIDVSNGTRLPGEPPLTPEQAFKRYLASDSAKILDSTGRYIGRGIRFSLHPDAWTETSCAERIWRLQPSLQIDNPPTQHNMVLYQDNAFGSQDCRASFGTVAISRAEPSVNLLTGDTSTFGPPTSSTALNIDGPLGMDHETLRTQPESSISGLAGRGLYGNYILLFPPLTWPDAEIAKVKDVLLRFDIVEVTHSAGL